MLVGCGDRYNSYKMFKSVESKYPNAKITHLSGCDWKFIVLDGDKIRYVKCGNPLDANISSDVILFVIEKQSQKVD
jgi:hypothetical protein